MKALQVEIDPQSGFCGGVIRAISRAESFLASSSPLYSLGSIVHNEAELGRLGAKGLVTISEVSELRGGETMLIRAHGEPPRTYELARAKGIEVIDCTCPVVLKLQQDIRQAHERGSLVVIFGKVGHAEVLGLVGQAGPDAVVVENMSMLEEAIAGGRIPRDGRIEVFSQTTKSPDGYKAICEALRAHVSGSLTVHDTICRQVASRHSQLADFAAAHDVVVFVAGKESSNGKVLLDLCRAVNARTYHALGREDIRPEWFLPGDRVGVCGATSTPKWLLEAVAQKILQLA